MRFHYYPETDSLYIDLSEKTGTDSYEVAPGVVLDLDDTGALIGIDLDHARKKGIAAGLLLSACVVAVLAIWARSARYGNRVYTRVASPSSNLLIHSSEIPQ